jgi:hypothetical protein
MAEKLVQCDTCGKRKSVGIVADRASCTPCAIAGHMGDHRPHAVTKHGRRVEDFVEALTMPIADRHVTIEQARKAFLDSTSRQSGAYYNELGRKLVEAANRFADGPLGVQRTVVVGHRHVNAARLVRAIKSLIDETNYGNGSSEMDEKEARQIVEDFAHHALRMLTAWAGGDSYQARALFKEVVRPTSGEYSGTGRPGVVHSIREDITDASIGYEYASDSGSDSGSDGEMIGDEQQIDWRLKVPGVKTTRFSYSTDQMADALIVEIAKQFDADSEGTKLADTDAFARYVTAEAQDYNVRSGRQSPVGEGQLTTRHKAFGQFLTIIGKSIEAANKQLKRPRKPSPKSQVPGARQFVADYAKKERKYTQFWANLYQMFDYWEAGYRRQTNTQASDPTRVKKILGDIQNVVNRATRIVALYYDGDQNAARALVQDQLLAMVNMLYDRFDVSQPAFAAQPTPTTEEQQREIVEAFHNNPNR